MKKLISIFLFCLASLAIIGCNSDANPVSTGFSDDANLGHSINLTISNDAVPYAGTVSMQVAVRDAAGKPIARSSLEGNVIFTSLLGGTFQSTPAYAEGVVSSSYTAPSVKSATTASLRADSANLPTNLPIFDEISVSYRGAIAKISVMLYSLN